MTVGFSQDKEQEKKLEELMKKHGIDVSTMKKQPEGDPEAEMKSLVSGVKDKGACFGELMKFMNDVSEEKEKDSGPAGKIKKTVFKAADIDGDKASVTFTVDGKDDDKPMIFTKTDGKWYIDMLATDKADGK